MIRVSRIAALLICLIGVDVQFGPAQEEVDLGEEARVAARGLEEARSAFKQADFARTVLLVNQLLDRLGPSAPGTLAVEQRAAVLEALRLRGISYFNLAQAEAAETDFAALLHYEPNAQLDAKLVSPKIIAAFERARDRTTGRLAVTSMPPGADVLLGQEPIGATPLDPTRVVAGSYRLRISKRGYEDIEERVQVGPGETVKRDFQLTRNSRSATLITSPPGARVLIDGREVGVTSGTPPPQAESALLSAGINPANASAPFTIPYLPAGDRRLRVEKECYRPMEGILAVDVAAGDVPMEIKPVVLKESLATALIDSVPPGADVYLDGQRVGAAPVRLDRLCAGRHQVRLEKTGVGRWSGEFDVQAGARAEVRGELRLSIVSFGAMRDEGELADTGGGEPWDGFLASILRRQKLYEMLPAPPPSSLARHDLHQRIAGSASEPAVLDDAVRRAMVAETGADLFLVATARGERGGEVLLYGRALGKPDRIPVERPDERTAEAVAARLSARRPLTVPWSGLFLVETAGNDQPFVLRVSPTSPAGTTVTTRDRIEAVDGGRVVSHSGFEGALHTRSPGSRVPVTVERGERRVDAVVVVAETPSFPIPGDRTTLFNKYVADLELTRALSTDTRTRALASIGIGIALLWAGEPELALERGFRRADLAEGAGVSRGTVAYLSGVCYEAMGGGSVKQAALAFAEAANSPLATLWRDDGPRVAPLAEAHSRPTR